MTLSEQPIYKRILLKLSGEALLGDKRAGIDNKILEQIVLEIKELTQLPLQIGIVIGGGNLIRGAAQTGNILTRVTADQMGMLATIINCLAMQDALKAVGLKTQIMSSISMPGIADVFNRYQAIGLLEKNHIMLFAGGTGNPLVTTDSAASLRAIEINADILLKATQVDGIYDADPLKKRDAKRYSQLTFDEALTQKLAVMDLTAFSQCNEHNMPLRVFNIRKPGAMHRIVMGDDEGTLVVR
ncbi:MAG: Uridylate kinase [Legionellaceae bacterium]